MKKSILVLVLVIVAGNVFAQEPHIFAKARCTTFSDRVLPVDTVEQIVFTEKQLRKGKFRFSYHNASNDSDVKRSFAIQDSTGKQVYSAEGSRFNIKASVLRDLLRQSSLTIFSMAIPSDPEKAKIVRVRPIEVARLSLR
ncbi:MAG: hypothetical protein EOO05_02635 [Chitinophagaceae bacterium]|nr:MAG: hypothetical protein EOO05_02635 [Chitinophagaceae bacterium]